MVRSSRARTHHPLDIRDWVIGLSPEQIHGALAGKIKIVDEAVSPYRDTLVTVNVRLLSEFTQQVFGAGPPQLPQAFSAWASRLAGFGTIACSYAQNSYQGKRFPQMAITGEPWEVFPDEVHVLDLPVPAIQMALEQSRKRFEALRQAPTEAQEARAGELDDQLVGEAIEFIAARPTAALVNPIVFYVLSYLLVIAHYGSDPRQQRRATSQLDAVLDAFRPDRSRRVSRREDLLVPRLVAYEELYAKVEPLMSDLRTEGPTPALLARFQDRVDPRIRLKDLQEWHRKRIQPRSVVLGLLSGRWKTRPRTLEDQLTLAGKARAIRKTWDDYQKFLETARHQTAQPDR